MMVPDLHDVLALLMEPAAADSESGSEKHWIWAQYRHTFLSAGLIAYERMVAAVDAVVDRVCERRREARRRELRALCEQEAQIKQRVTEIVREADGDGDWQAAGCSSSAAWLAQISSSEETTVLPRGRNARRVERRTRPRPPGELAASGGAMNVAPKL